MPIFRNVTLNIVDQGISTKCLVTPGEDFVPCTIIGADTTVSLKNKNLLDPSNSIAATNLSVNGTIMPIIGTAATGEVLTVNGGNLEFVPATGVSSDFVKYVSSQNTSVGTGTIDDPYQTITAAITALGSGSAMKYIVVLPGTYDEDILVYPNTTITGSGEDSAIQSPANTFGYHASVTNFDGLIAVSGMTLDAISLDSSTQSGSAAIYNFSSINAASFSAPSNTTTTNNEILLRNCIFTTMSVVIRNGLIDDLVSSPLITVLGLVQIKQLFAQTLTITGPIDPDFADAEITLSNIRAVNFVEGINVLVDSQSFMKSTLGVRSSIGPINTNANFLMTDTCTYVGTNIVPNLMIGCTAIGAGIVGINAESVNRTGVGFNATVTADNQVAFSDGATALRAAGLTGHAAATNVTYDTVTGLINYATSSAKNKEDISALCPDRSGLLIDSIIPRKYRWKVEKKYSPGLIAEEIAEVISEIDCESMQDLVARDGDGNVVTVNYTLFIPHLINCIKDLRDRVSALEQMK